jgi:hypothetical protein
MQAIKTTYHGPTDTRGARIKAACERGSCYIPYPYELGPGEECHIAAADELCRRFYEEDAKRYGFAPEQSTWNRPRITGALKDCYVHVFTG